MRTTTNDDGLHSQLRALRHLLRRFERLQSTQLVQQNCCSGLTFAQCHPLLEIGSLERVTIGELAARLGLDKSTLSRTVDDLVRRGLVKRRADRRDRRFVVTTLTAEGRRICDEINGRNDEFYGRLLSGMPGGRRGDFIDLFRRFVEAFENAIAGRGEPTADRSRALECRPFGRAAPPSSTTGDGP